MAAVSSKSFEVNLQGEVSKNEYSAFEERIRGLCGNDTEKLDKVESKDELPLDSVPFDAYLVEVYSVTTDDKIDDVSHQINRFAIDLEPYLVARPSEGKDFQIHKETLLAESKKKKQKLR
ncbi:hypothetical protein B5M09_000245 [Aphanomyces astaci]|uniref:Uncharacterized protein n=1 Tax=Aphanomyces astaci TaxID=112090 RepID=A0A3R8DDE1_APHAT|nr:hypothetical protein B5M09_000245 [Aphanomyces astaci]